MSLVAIKSLTYLVVKFYHHSLGKYLPAKIGVDSEDEKMAMNFKPQLGIERFCL